MANTTERVTVVDAYPQDGDVYALREAECPGETTSDTYVIAVDADGNRYLHRAFKVRGWYRSHEEGWQAVTPRWAAERDADAFIAKVLAQGSIDPALWQKLPEQVSPAPTYWDEDERNAGRHLGYAAAGVL